MIMKKNYIHVTNLFDKFLMHSKCVFLMDIFIIEPPIWQNMMEFLVLILPDLNAFNVEHVEILNDSQ